MTDTITRADVSNSATHRRYLPGRFPTLLLVIATVLAVLAAFGGYEVVRHHKPTFRSQGAISLDQPQKFAAANDSGIIDKISRSRAVYVGLAKTDAIREAINEQLGLPKGRAAGQLFTLADRGSLLLIVGAQARSAPAARRIATALANELVVAIERQQDLAKIQDKDRVVAAVVIEPRGAALVSPTKRKGVTAGVIAGLLVFLGVFGVGSLLRRRPVS